VSAADTAIAGLRGTRDVARQARAGGRSAPRADFAVMPALGVAPYVHPFLVLPLRASQPPYAVESWTSRIFKGQRPVTSESPS
jgi:hypothetical protein